MASSPFDRTDADAILRSADGVDFHVHQSILSIASPFFDGLLSIPQPVSPKEPSVLPVVPFNEDSVTLDILLRGLYPVDVPVINDANVLIKVLQAADKYQVLHALDPFQQRYIDLWWGDICEHPVKAYTLGCQYKWINLMRAAAKTALDFPHDQILAQFEALECPPTAIECVQFIRYHSKCSSATRSFLHSHNAVRYSHMCITNARATAEGKGPMAVVKEIDSAVDIDGTIWSGNSPASQNAELFGLPSLLRRQINQAVTEENLGLPFQMY
ncbi:hypothetical protein ONZ45_g10089 [Pleurotus djamor]|nr:hypothetical protein ONZ45_g10089 [Pleurotus djamor]